MPGSRPRPWETSVAVDQHARTQRGAFPCSGLDCTRLLCGVPLWTFRVGSSGLEIFSQIVAQRKFRTGQGGVLSEVAGATAAVDARKPICYKNASAPYT